MAISTPTSKLSAGNTANQSTYDTAVVTLDAGKWYIMAISGYAVANAAITSVVHDPLGTALNFTLISDGVTSAVNNPYDTSVNHRNHELWAVKPNSTTANALIRITWPSSRSAAGWSLTEIASGFATSGQWVQVKKATGTAGTTASLTMNSFVDGNSLLFVSWAIGTGTGDPLQNITPTESRTELIDVDDGERTEHADHYQNPNGGDTSLTSTWSSSMDWSALGVEMKAAAGGGFILPPTLYLQQAIKRSNFF